MTAGRSLGGSSRFRVVICGAFWIISLASLDARPVHYPHSSHGDKICPFGQNFPVYSFTTAKLFRNPRADSREHVRANAYKSGAIIGQRVNQVKRHYHQKRKPRQALQGQPGSVCFDIQNTSARSLASIRRAVNPSHCSFPKSNQQRFRP